MFEKDLTQRFSSNLTNWAKGIHNKATNKILKVENLTHSVYLENAGDFVQCSSLKSFKNLPLKLKTFDFLSTTILLWIKRKFIFSILSSPMLSPLCQPAPSSFLSEVWLYFLGTFLAFPCLLKRHKGSVPSKNMSNLSHLFLFLYCPLSTRIETSGRGVLSGVWWSDSGSDDSGRSISGRRSCSSGTLVWDWDLSSQLEQVKLWTL